MSNPMYYISNQTELVDNKADFYYILATGSIPHVRFNFITQNPSKQIIFSFFRKYESGSRGTLLKSYTLNDNLLGKPTMEVFTNSSFRTDSEDEWCDVIVSSLTQDKGSINLVLKANALYGLTVSTASSATELFGLSMNWTEEA